MEVTFTLTPDDCLHFARRYRPMNLRPAFLHAALGLALILAATDLWFAQDVWHKTGSAPWGLLVSLAVTLWMGFLLLPPTRGRIARSLRRQSGFLLPQFLSIGPEWLFGRTGLDEAKYFWQTIYSLEEDADYLFLFISKGRALIVPKRAFATSNEAQTFLDTSRRHWEARKGQPLPAEDVHVWPPPPSVSGPEPRPEKESSPWK